MEILLILNLAVFPFKELAPVPQQIDSIKEIIVPNIVKFGTYALTGVGAGILIRSIAGR